MAGSGSGNPGDVRMVTLGNGSARAISRECEPAPPGAASEDQIKLGRIRVNLQFEDKSSDLQTVIIARHVSIRPEMRRKYRTLTVEHVRTSEFQTWVAEKSPSVVEIAD